MKNLDLLEDFLIYQADILNLLDLKDKTKVQKLLSDEANNMLDKYTPLALAQVDICTKICGLTDILMQEHETLRFNIRLKLYCEMLIDIKSSMMRVLGYVENYEDFWADRTNKSSGAKISQAFSIPYQKANEQIVFILNERVGVFDKILLEADVPPSLNSSSGPANHKI